MSELETHIKRVHTRLHELIKNYASLQKENQELKELVAAFQKQEKDHKEIILVLNQKVNILQAASGKMDEESRKEFEKRINSYLKEIDKCISMLSE